MKPGPDPNNVEDTTFMTKQSIYNTAFKQSHSWVAAGSGNLGKIYLEILSCDNLPDLDVGTAGNVTDAFISVVHEDAMVCTDVIWNALNPRWQPWTNRAFIFSMQHASSNVFIGAFDYDARIKNPEYEFIGRISINITNLTPNTDYVLRYNLKKERYNPYELESRGIITVRIRVVYDERKALLSSLGPTPVVKLYSPNRLFFKSVRTNVYGERNMEQLSYQNIRIYQNELQEVSFKIYNIFFRF